MNVLLTGASGFVGRATLARLRAEGGVHVRAAVRRPLPAGRDAGMEEIVIGAVDGDTDWSLALRDVDVVVHLAARVHIAGERGPAALQAFRRVNTEGTVNLARQAAVSGVRRLVFVSSVKVNGNEGAFTETDPPQPVGPYAISKHEAELGARRAATGTALEITIVRPPLVYGPGVRANFRFLMKAVAAGIPLPLAAISNRRSLVAAANLADFLVSCTKHPAAADELFFVSDGEDVSSGELVRRLARAMGRPARLWPLKPALLKTVASLAGYGDLASRLIDTFRVDITKARTLLGWAPPLGLDQGLAVAVGGGPSDQPRANA